MPDSVRALALLPVAFSLLACASVSTDKVTPVYAPSAAPQRIYVQDFEMPEESVRVDRGGKALGNFRRNFAEQFTRATTERVRKRLGPASELRRDAEISSAPAWLITGRFLTVNQGSRALRAAVGLGAGGTKLETFVTVYDLSGASPRPILRFVTTGGSNAQPGAVFGLIMPNYWLIAADMVGKGLPGLSADVIRTSREIVAVVSEYMAKQGFLPAAKILRAKQLGKWP